MRFAVIYDTKLREEFNEAMDPTERETKSTVKVVKELKHEITVQNPKRKLNNTVLFDVLTECHDISTATEHSKKLKLKNGMTKDERRNENEVRVLDEAIGKKEHRENKFEETRSMDEKQIEKSMRLSKETSELQRKCILELLQAEPDIKTKEFYECIVCGQDFPVKEELAFHLENSHLSMDDFNLSSINKKRFLNASLRLQPSESTLLECLLCRKKFSNKRSLSSHLTVYHFSPQIQKVHECQFCGKVFKFHSRLIRHYNVHTQEKEYNCSVCGKGFSCKDNMAQHERKHFPENHFECDVCGKTLTTKDGLTTHMRIHTGEKPYECKICHKKFSGRRLLRQHMKMILHASESEVKTFKCEVCPQLFLRKVHLRAHMVAHRENDQAYCGVCGKGFKSKWHLRHHEKIHTGIRTHQCEICERSFYHKCDLQGHMTVHTGVKNYRCDLCNKEYTGHSSLVAHKQSVHESQLFKCSFCTREYKTKKILSAHVIEKHTACKEYPCQYCVKKFSSRSKLKCHIQRRHKGIEESEN